nr:MAG TPA: DNA TOPOISOMERASE IV, B SUBUNIT [Caudoviricetes sp.]
MIYSQRKQHTCIKFFIARGGMEPLGKEKQFQDDKFVHLASDTSKLRQKSMMFISHSNELAAKSVSLEALYNAIDECRNPRSPADQIIIRFDESSDTITFEDNGRGIPHDVLKMVFTTLNSGSNIDSSMKNDLETDTLGRNGVGTLALSALGERTEIISYRGGTENKSRRLLFIEGDLKEDDTHPCDAKKHGLFVSYKPSKVLGKRTRIVWKMIHDELVNLQFLNQKKLKMESYYTNLKGETIHEVYKTQPFENIIALKNGRDQLISAITMIGMQDRNVVEEISGKNFKRFVRMEVAFAFTSNPSSPYIDSFCNSNNTVDNGSHLDAAIEGLCRYFQQVTKASLSERDKLDIKWDDVKLGLSVAVSLHTNMENLFTGQTKHKVYNEDLGKLLKDLTVESLQNYFKENPTKLKEFIQIVKTNAKARREGDKARQSVVKETLTNWGSFRMKNYDPCTNKGKEYKELYIIEGDRLVS